MDEPGLTMEAVYDDVDLVEVRVVVRNGTFAGQASVYAGVDEFGGLADALAGFPRNVQDHRQVEWGDLSKGSGLGGLAMQFTCIDPAGHAGVWVELKSADTDPGQPLQTVRPFLPVEASAIDRFVQEMRLIGQQKRGTAHLTGVQGGRTRG